MSSYWGYVGEATVFTVLWVWYTVHTFVKAVKCQATGEEFKPRLSHPWPGTAIPAETIFKVICSGLGVLITVFDDGLSWVDDHGNYRKMATVISMSIYGIFLVHSLLELVLWLGFPVVRDADYVSCALGFLWYAMASFYRAKDFISNGHTVVVMVKTFPLYPSLAIAVSVLMEMLHRSGYWTQMVRVFCLGLLATWDWNAALILHSPQDFPGRGPSDWNMKSHSSTGFIGAAFGDHLCLHILWLIVIYALTAVYLRVVRGVRICHSLLDKE